MTRALPPAPLTQETVRLNALGRQIWIGGGDPLSATTDSHSLSYAGGGAIGRALVQTPASGIDGRFNGDIAEVIVDSVGLDDADRAAIEGDLVARWLV